MQSQLIAALAASVVLSAPAAGVASLRDLSSSNEITVVAVPKAEVDKIGPPFVAANIPANTCTGQDNDVPTAAVINYLVTSSADRTISLTSRP